MGMESILTSKYHDWVFKNIIESDQYDVYKYSKLMGYLQTKEFYYSYPMDANRVADANSLKVRFGQGLGISVNDRYFCEWVNFTKVTVFDVMAALALRVYEEVTWDFDPPIRQNDIFWIMIESMHLDRMNDNDFDLGEVIRRVENMLYRRFESDGDGGLFRVRGIQRNMREAEIWYQMQWWAASVFERYNAKEGSDAGLPNCIDSNN